ncbi:hypothetical protein ADU59_22915 [Pararhizobium polonicum]|uniref:Flavin-nucleotide-binding protein n=1 Tax=Pararhizobium polonicum TaxID=1612624 RepID=A0A1C7NWE2_9HYPH|nr:pyridoxamine 5'-phosphate oxidase family protein [Pararhizobium polonicum]OBZ93300.1 hypothetical protein ADU59_22915 [Pararhizobium polonicum]
MIVKDMSSENCADVLSRGHIAHLACARDNRPYVVPIQYVFESPSLYSFSMPGQKIDWLRTNPNVCVQVGEIKDNEDWQSVVVEGRYEEFPDDAQWHDERLHAWSLLEKRASWWEPGALKPGAAATGEKAMAPVFFTIHIDSVTGRQSSVADT